MRGKTPHYPAFHFPGQGNSLDESQEVIEDCLHNLGVEMVQLQVTWITSILSERQEVFYKSLVAGMLKRF